MLFTEMGRHENAALDYILNVIPHVRVVEQPPPVELYFLSDLLSRCNSYTCMCLDGGVYVPACLTYILCMYVEHF